MKKIYLLATILILSVAISYAQKGDIIKSLPDSIQRTYSSATSTVTVPGWTCGTATYNGHSYQAACFSYYSSSQIYQKKSGLAAVAIFGTYASLSVKPDIPAVCDGPAGADSTIPGPAGPGVPPGGTDGQILTKKGFANYSTHWSTPTSTVDWSGITGLLNSTVRPDLYNTFEPKNSNIQAHIGSTNNPHAVTADQVLPTQAGNAGKVLGTNGSTSSWVTGGSGSGTPGGSNKQVQYNNNGVFAGFGRYSSGCLIL